VQRVETRRERRNQHAAERVEEHELEDVDQPGDLRRAEAIVDPMTREQLDALAVRPFQEFSRLHRREVARCQTHCSPSPS
jgi:hypothetical protein